jgi:hypothetical protein
MEVRAWARGEGGGGTNSLTTWSEVQVLGTPHSIVVDSGTLMTAITDVQGVRRGEEAEFYSGAEDFGAQQRRGQEDGGAC